ncbi:MAG: hypothetical protein MJK04_05940, partial [Psychrosphaera sp.]|nr:hypothetical protein [Psychrosphaera sp.]
MLDLNFRRSQQWRRSDTLVLPARTKRASHSLFLILLLNILLLVAANAFGSEVTVNLIDAQTNQSIANNEITAYQVDADGALDWHSRHTTDESGQAVFNLDNLEGGTVYVLRSKVYNGFKNYSGAIPNQPNFDFVVGKVRVALTNGSVDGLPPLANAQVGIKRLAEDGKYDWFSSATTDEAGMLRLNLPDIDNGQVYKLSARSTANQARKYSAPLSSEGDFNFVVGNKP